MQVDGNNDEQKRMSCILMMNKKEVMHPKDPNDEQKGVHPVGFEPTHSKILELESSPLDQLGQRCC